MTLPRYPEELGFKIGASGTHTSRTIMVEELSTLLASAGSAKRREEFARLIVDENVLGKSTASTRRLTAQRLSELYALDISVPLFRALMRLWPVDKNSRPLLALLCSLARDPLLRAAAPSIISLREGQSFVRDTMTTALCAHARSRLNDSTLDKVVRNAAASWTQSRHLRGRVLKRRQRVTATPAAVTMALLLGYLQGLRGPSILQTLWCAVLDSTPEALSSLALRASLTGLLRFRHADGVVEISFPDLLTKQEIEVASHGQD
jgi:hypothetical protein